MLMATLAGVSHWYLAGNNIAILSRFRGSVSDSGTTRLSGYFDL